jgi:hypothetical protein
MSVFWGAHQRFFKQLCMAMKVPALVADGLQALDEGNAVIVGLQSTGECHGLLGVCLGFLVTVIG